MNHRCRTTSIVIACVLLLLVGMAPPAAGQQQEKITVEWIYSDSSAGLTALPRFTWLDDNTALLYDPRKPEEVRTFERLDPKTGRRTPVLDMRKALQSLEKLLGEEKTPDLLPWPVALDRRGRKAAYLFQGDIYLLDLKKAQFSRVTDTGEGEKAIRFSPDGRRLAYVRANDLYEYDIDKSAERRLTRDGSDTILNGTLTWLYWEEIFDRRDIGYWWSEDSKAIAFLRTDQSPVSVMRFVDFEPYVPRVLTQRYPKAGTDNPIVRVGIVEVETGKTTWVDLNDHPYEYLARVKWLPDSRRLSVETLNRPQTELDLYFADRFTGKVTPVLQETDKAWVNIHDDLYFLKDGAHFIWASERDGYAHLYRYTMDGKLVNKITRGDWAIRSAGGGVYWLRQAVVGIDEEQGWIYFTALKKSSVERHLYRIHFDGSGLERLSKEEGFHSISASPNARYYLDRFSNIRTPPSLSLYRSDGTLQRVLAPARTELVAKYDMQLPDLFTIPAGDGFPLPAQLLKPRDFDPHKKYPLILYVYGGPSAPAVQDQWSTSIYFDQILLRKGYLVGRVDNRSATAISKKLENLILGQMSGPVELKDLLAAVRWWKSQPYVDPDRVGIWGWSGGGSFTLNAMTHSKEFKAGIAVAAVTDWHFYDTKWAEFAMKRPQDNPEGYEKTSLVKAAGNLHGRLLLVHGTGDDNVHPQNAWAFINELIKADKRFELMMYPMRKHHIGDRPARIHLFHTMLEFWQRNL